MRPISTEQNLLQYPLNELLGTGAHVRLLRILANEAVGPLAVPDAAERAGLTEAGARRALGRLSKTGFVVRVGGGRSQQFALREQDPLVIELSRLFRAEQTRFDELLAAIRVGLDGLQEICAAWIESLPERVGQPLEIALVADADSISWLSDETQTRLATVETSFDVTVEVHAYTRADAPEVDPRQVTLLAGVLERGVPGSRARLPTHRDRDERALRLSRAISRLLERNPSLIRGAMRHLDRLLAEGQGTAAHDLREWRNILDTYSLKRLQEFLVSKSSRATRLRQSSPFFAVLDADERDRVLSMLEENE